ncbi:PLP-dependent aminotransferase family protein [Myxococcaceae bacterium JPH2]|nr:PLP-dependent aminotransferase family protein [Myxococcaceae bacterium JPH2]
MSPSAPRRRGPRKRPALMATTLVLDASSGAPLQQQLVRALHSAILERRLAPGSRLPSSRALADELDLSRNTVMNAYAQLLAEGYLEGRAGSGTYVATELPERLLHRARASPRAPRDPRAPALSRRGSHLASLTPPFGPEWSRPMLRAFQLGTPALDAFPGELWGRLLHRRWQRSWRDMLAHRDVRGALPLRRAIASYLGTSRGVRCVPEQVLIVNGSQQAIGLVAQVLLDPGDAVWVEDPGYLAARGALQGAGATLVPVPVDAEGLDVEAATRLRPDARLAVVTPSNQFPLCVTMSPQRREALLAWARRTDAWVFEDDYDSEFRYAGRPLPSLQGLASDSRVLYCGTFSKVLTSSLRLGYLVVPESLVDAFAAARMYADVQSPTLEQAVLTDFIQEGHFSRHVRRMRVLYAKRQARLVEAARRELKGALDVAPSDTGLHLVGWLPEGADDLAVSARAAERGVQALGLSQFRTAPRGRHALLLGYACVPEPELDMGVRRLAEALD